MTDDLVKRLRSFHSRNRHMDRHDAADRIEELEAALQKIAQHDMQAIAMDALRPGARVRESKDG